VETDVRTFDTTTPGLLALSGWLPDLLAHGLIRASFVPDTSTGVVTSQTAAWYHKREPTSSDAIAAVRHALWCPPDLCMSRSNMETVQIPATLLQRLTDTLCHAT